MLVVLDYRGSAEGMVDTAMEVLVRIAEAEADAERLQELTDRLRAELLELDVEDVAAVPGGEPPPGTRAVDVAAVGALLVSITDSVHVLEQVIAAVRSWVGRGSAGRAVELTIGDNTLRVAHASTSQQDCLINEFIRAVARDRPQ